MTIASRLRFTAPVDPRAVFTFAAALVNMPEGSFRHEAPGSEPLYEDDWWPINPRIRTAGGSDAYVTVEYGAEGSLLIEEYDDPRYADDYTAAQRDPRAYVLLTFESSGGHLYEKHHDWVAAVAAWSPVPMFQQDFTTGEWSPMLWPTEKAQALA